MRRSLEPRLVIPAKAGIHPSGRTPLDPAFAGVTGNPSALIAAAFGIEARQEGLDNGLD
jgi:hypothetical protein